MDSWTLTFRNSSSHEWPVSTCGSSLNPSCVGAKLRQTHYQCSDSSKLRWVAWQHPLHSLYSKSIELCQKCSQLSLSIQIRASVKDLRRLGFRSFVYFCSLKLMLNHNKYNHYIFTALRISRIK